jgi:hypothetical protein
LAEKFSLIAQFTEKVLLAKTPHTEPNHFTLYPPDTPSYSQISSYFFHFAAERSEVWQKFPKPSPTTLPFNHRKQFDSPKPGWPNSSVAQAMSASDSSKYSKKR